jgi:hypothetical protein
MTLNRLNFYPKQIVTDTDLNTLQANVENADYNLAMDLGLSGVVSGLEVSPNSPNDLKVAYTKGVAYDAYGKRIAASGNGLIDCSSYAVSNSGYERWISIVIEFARNAYDTRAVDSGTIYYYQDAYFSIGIVAGTIAATGAASKPAVSASQVVLADIKLTYGQTAITADDIDIARRVVSSIDDEHIEAKVYNTGGVHGFATDQPCSDNEGQMLVWNNANAKHIYSGNAPTASKLADARTIELTGAINGSGSFDGSTNLTINTTSTTEAHGKQKFIASGTFTVPTGITKLWVTLAGAGGGGGDGDYVGPDDTGSYNYYAGGSGGSGQIIWADEITVTPGEEITVTIGTGGAAGADGGDSSFGSYVTAAGGNAGGDATSTSIGVAGAAGGSREISINHGIGGAGGYSNTYTGDFTGHSGTDGICLVEY